MYGRGGPSGTGFTFTFADMTEGVGDLGVRKGYGLFLVLTCFISASANAVLIAAPYPVRTEHEFRCEDVVF